ncbi:MAG: hypothetical protein ACETWK_02060 [Candidatus Aminicenantaceae bacterium]
MKILKTNGMRKLFALPLIVLLFILIANPSAPKALRADCDKGLVKCMASAVLAGLANPALGISMIGFCLNGYAFCLEFFE